MGAHIKKINKQSQLRIKLNASNAPAIKPLFKSYNLAPTNLLIAIKVVVIFFVLSAITKTYSGPINMSNVIRERLILQEKKIRYNNLGLCRYYNKPKHIAIDQKNLTLLTTQK